MQETMLVFQRASLSPWLFKNVFIWFYTTIRLAPSPLGFGALPLERVCATNVFPGTSETMYVGKSLDACISVLVGRVEGMYRVFVLIVATSLALLLALKLITACVTRLCCKCSTRIGHAGWSFGFWNVSTPGFADSRQLEYMVPTIPRVEKSPLSDRKAKRDALERLGNHYSPTGQEKTHYTK